MRRVALATLAVLACAAPAFAAVPRLAKQIGGTQTLMPNVTYQRLVQFTSHGPVVLHVLTAPRPGGLYALRPVLSNNTIVGRERVTDMQTALAATATVAGTNGDLFNLRDGRPSGVLMRSGVLDSAPLPERSSIGIDSVGTLRVDWVSFNAYWKGTGQRRPLQLNAPPVKTNTVTLYTPAWGPATPAESGPVLAETLTPFPATTPNVDLTGTVASVQQAAGGVPIPAGGAVLVARGNQAPIVGAEALVGAPVLVHLTLTPSWAGVTDALGGGPVIVRNGRPVFRASELFSTEQLLPRDPRAAIGQLPDGRIVLVAVDGRQPGYSVGVTNFELAQAMQQLGCLTASALDAGGSTTMAFEGQLLNKPSDPGGELQVAEALLVEYFGVYVPAPSVTVLSPNGDGVDELQTLGYKIVRPSTVTASVVGPDGVARPIDSGQKDPGAYTFSWAGLREDGTPEPEGSYQFTVAAVDDQGQSSTSSRPFSIDETLGFLVSQSKIVIRKTGVALRGTYQLAHPATVTAQIQTQSGIAVRTLYKAVQQAGQQSVAWDGRIGAGTRAFGGSYQLVVSATNALGTATLSQAFTARRG
jgi:flagellar hook assembly protein FlgD